MGPQPPRIDLLPEHLIDQIKAGEVIERPGNLLKEILENAVDAGATKLELTLRGNGLDLISLKDNGHGMRFGDLPLAFSRHATSKIKDFNDLYRLSSYGFRGEALASIAAVAKVQCLSFTSSDEQGAELRIEGGLTVLHETRQKSREHGTELVIQDLFFNTPARLKFIHGQQTEKNFLRKVIFAFVLSHPGIEFHVKLDDEDKEIFPAAPTLRERLALIYPKAMKDILSIDKYYENTELQLHLIPSHVRTPGKWQMVFINGRLILDKQLHRVMSNALMSAFGLDDFQYVASIDLPPDTIDVNVHPNKTIIKCLEISKIISLLTSTVKELAKPRATSSLPASSAPWPDLFAYSSSSSESPELTLPQNRHAYNMEGLFSPHGLSGEREGGLHWIGAYFFRREGERWLAVNAPKLLNHFVHARLRLPTSTLPLLVSEPFFSRCVKPEVIARLCESGLELEFLGKDTLVLRGIPDWMNGFPLKEIVERLLHERDLTDLDINTSDWSESTWEEMLASFSPVELEEAKISCDLHELLRQRLK